jgi:hypothetical protein
MASPDQIATALLARVATLVTGSPTLPVAYPDRPFTPPADGKYLDVAVFFNRPAWEGVASGKVDQGLLQITVVWPRNTGIIKPMEVVSTVMAHFTKGATLTGTVKVAAEPYSASPIFEGSETRIPVTIPWTA